MKSILQFILILAVAAGAPIAVAAGGAEVGKTIVAFKDKDPSIDKRFAKAHGFAIFPSVGKGAFIVGAGGGKGEVFERGKLIGTARMTQFTIGAQIGGGPTAR